MANRTQKHERNLDEDAPINQQMERPNQKVVTPRGPKLTVIEGGAGRRHEESTEGDRDIIDEALKNQSPQQPRQESSLQPEHPKHFTPDE